MSARRAIHAALVAGALAACAARPAGHGQPSTATLTVFAAASLTDALGEIGRGFESTRPGVKVSVSFAGSQQLAQQIAQGAPADVFASANTAQMDAAVQSGRIAPGAPKAFAGNRLVAIAAAGSGITRLTDLARPGVKIALADRAVPAGAYALEVLRKASALPEYGATYGQTVLANVVSYEHDVKAVVGKVRMGEVDAGIVYATDLSDRETLRVAAIPIPDALNTPVVYPIAALTESPQPSLAAAFVDYALGADAQAILARAGFLPAPR